MIHSIITVDDIFFDFSTKTAQTEFIPLEYGCLEVYKKGRKVRRVISTDPKDYLNKKYQPF